MVGLSNRYVYNALIDNRNSHGEILIFEISVRHTAGWIRHDLDLYT